jgi:hypothetical protein
MRSGHADSAAGLCITASARGEGWVGGLPFMNHMDHASPAVATMPIAAVDHLVKAEHSRFRRALPVAIDHRASKQFDFALVGWHVLVLRLGIDRLWGIAGIKPYAIKRLCLNA